MQLDAPTAALAGLVGGLVMLAPHVSPTALRMNVIVMWGTLFRLRGDQARAIGLAIHFALSALVGIIYALGFQLLGVRDGLLLWGVIGGLVHWLMGGLFLALVPPLHPEIPERQPAPGVFAARFGLSDAAAFLAAHLAYALAFTFVYTLAQRGGGLKALV